MLSVLTKAAWKTRKQFVVDSSPMLGDLCINPELFNMPLFTPPCQTVPFICKFGGFAQNGETNFWSISFFPSASWYTYKLAFFCA